MRQFFEAPIDIIGFGGDRDTTGSLDREDKTSRVLVQNPRWEAKVRRMFEKTPFTFNFYFINVPKGRYRGSETYKVYDRITDFPMWPYIADQFKFDPEAINIVYTTNFGNRLMPMTGWVLAHRFCHVFQFDIANHPYFDNIERLIYNAFLKVAGAVYRYPTTKPLRYPTRGPVLFDDPPMMKELANTVFSMRSARNQWLTNSLDLTGELMAQWLITGKVTFHPLPAVVQAPGAYNFEVAAIPQAKARADRLLQQFAVGLPRLFVKLLTRYKGKILAF